MAVIVRTPDRTTQPIVPRIHIIAARHRMVQRLHMRALRPRITLVVVEIADNVVALAIGPEAERMSVVGPDDNGRPVGDIHFAYLADALVDIAEVAGEGLESVGD